MEIEAIWRAWFRRSLYNTLIGNRKLREREREKERLRAHKTLWLQPRFLCVCVCVCVLRWRFVVFSSGGRRGINWQAIQTHMKVKKCFFPFLQLWFVLGFVFLFLFFQTLCLGFGVLCLGWMCFGRRKEEKKEKTKK